MLKSSFCIDMRRYDRLAAEHQLENLKMISSPENPHLTVASGLSGCNQRCSTLPMFKYIYNDM